MFYLSQQNCCLLQRFYLKLKKWKKKVQTFDFKKSSESRFNMTSGYSPFTGESTNLDSTNKRQNGWPQHKLWIDVDDAINKWRTSEHRLVDGNMDLWATAEFRSDTKYLSKSRGTTTGFRFVIAELYVRRLVLNQTTNTKRTITL